ncbi:hypothetical protein HN51_040081 [Arachis hypogaea]
MTTSALPSPDSPPTAAFSHATCATNASTIPIPTSLLFPLDDSSFSSLTRLSCMQKLTIFFGVFDANVMGKLFSYDGGISSPSVPCGLHLAVMEMSLWGWPLGRWNG